MGELLHINLLDIKLGMKRWFKILIENIDSVLLLIIIIIQCPVMLTVIISFHDII